MQAPVIETQRLLLRPFIEDDCEALIRNLMADPQVMARLPVQPTTYEAQRVAAMDYITSLTVPWKDKAHGGWAVCLRPNGSVSSVSVIGYCGFFELEPDAGPEVEGLGPEFGYGFAKRFWGQGLATEAGTAALDAIFSSGEVSSIFATCDVDHWASRRVLEKTGVRYIRDVNAFNSAADGSGLLSLHVAEREPYQRFRRDAVRAKVVFGLA